MRDVSDLMIQRQSEKDESLGFTRCRGTRCGFLFTGDRHQVLTNVPTGTLFPFGVCRAIPGTVPVRYWWYALPRSMDPRHRDRDDKGDVAVPFRNRRFQSCDRQPSQPAREMAGNVRIDLRFVVCRRTVLAPQTAFQHFRDGIPSLTSQVQPRINAAPC